MKEYSTAEQRIEVVRALWYEWMLGFGSVTLVVLASLVASPVFLSILVAGIAWGLNVAGNNLRMRLLHNEAIVSLSLLTAKALYVAAALMMFISLLFQSDYVHWFEFSTQINPQIPYVAALIVFPLTLAVGLYGLYANRRALRRTIRDNTRGLLIEEGFIGNYLHHQTMRNLKLMVWLSLFLSALDWAYYFVFYHNTDINAPDTFFYVAVPALMYVLSLVYVWKYSSYVIANIQRESQMSVRRSQTVIMRFLVVNDDNLLLAVDDNELFDTPIESMERFFERVSTGDARKVFSRLSGCSVGEYEVRELFNNPTATQDARMYHYIVKMTSTLEQTGDKAEVGNIKGIWAPLADISEMQANHTAAPSLAAEIHRVYTIGMAWKTYHHDGRRRYPIKHYRPTFRLRDVIDMDVDFNDTLWFDVADCNEDCLAWRVKRVWRRLCRRKEG